MSSDLLQSYEHDFKDCCKHLQEIIDDANPGAKLEKNQYAFDNASKLLKQMEVEAMNFMEDDSIRKRVSFSICLTNTFLLIALDVKIQIRLRQNKKTDSLDIAW